MEISNNKNYVEQKLVIAARASLPFSKEGHLFFFFFANIMFSFQDLKIVC